MSVGVLDTGVLIGICVEKDQHHKNCYEYVVDDDNKDCYATPTVKREFEDVEEHIRTELSREIRKHREKITNEIDEGKLDKDDLHFIRDTLLDKEFRAYTCLYEYYTQKAKTEYRIDKLELEFDLNDMETEVWESPVEEDIWNIVEYWDDGVKEDTKVRKSILVKEGDDVEVCMEAHHVAKTLGLYTELATVNPRHFIEHVKGEPESREENIKRHTKIDEVVDLSYPKVP
jgi:hypothetical protein